MKTLFQCHFPDSADEIAAAWKDAIIVFDANTLLNLYRYSNSSREEFLTLLGSLKDRIWTPEQAAREYFKNRTTVIGSQAKSYDTAKSSISDLRESLRKDRGHPFISESTMNELDKMLDVVESELDKNKRLQETRITSDDVMDKIINLFDGRVGEKFEDQELQEIFEEGKARYEQEIPPGYKDASKHKAPATVAENRSVFGDLIVWKQIISKAKATGKAIIFVTDDTKEDWWLEAQGKTLGPRIELLEEFRSETGQKFYMYRPDQFLKYAKDQLNSKVSAETIEEIRATDENRAISEEFNSTTTHGNSRKQIDRLRNFIAAQHPLFSESELQESKSGILGLLHKRQNRLPFDEESAQIDYRIIDIESQLEALSNQGELCRTELQRINSAIGDHGREELGSRSYNELLSRRDVLRARLPVLLNDMSHLRAEFHDLISQRNRD